MAVGFGITQNDLKGFAGVQGDLIFGALGGAVKGAQGGAIIFPYHTNTGGLVGGGLVGVETAEYLASRGCKVTIIEMMDQIAKEESNTILPTLMRELEHYNVQIVTSAKLSEIKDDSVVVEKTVDDNTSTEEIASDFVVMAVGARKNLPELSDCPLPLHYIGDCAGERPSNIEHAIKSAYDVACEI